MSDQTTPISVALDRAEGALRAAEWRCGGPDAMLTRETCAIAIAAFLRALPDQTVLHIPGIKTARFASVCAAEIDRSRTDG